MLSLERPRDIQYMSAESEDRVSCAWPGIPSNRAKGDEESRPGCTVQAVTPSALARGSRREIGIWTSHERDRRWTRPSRSP